MGYICKRRKSEDHLKSGATLPGSYKGGSVTGVVPGLIEQDSQKDVLEGSLLRFLAIAFVAVKVVD